MKKRNVGYTVLFILPTFIIFTVFIIVPIVLSIYYSMTNWNGLSSPVFVWLDNYRKLLGDKDYWTVLKNTGTVIGISVIFQIPIGLTLAFLIFKTRRGAKFFRSAYFLPVVIAPLAIGVMFTLFLNSELGPINIILAKLGLEFLQRAWLSDSRTVLYSVMFPMIWQYIGFYVVIYLAAMYSLPEELLESAAIDGANVFQVFFKIVIPMLWDVIGITVVLCTVGGLKAFEHPYIMTTGGPGVLSSYVGLYVYKLAFAKNNFGYGSTVGVTVLLIALISTILFRRFVFRPTYEA